MNCPGPSKEGGTGALYCPRDPQTEPDDGDWQRFCDECQALHDFAVDRAVDWDAESRWP